MRSTLGLLVGACLPSPLTPTPRGPSLGAIEAAIGGRLGVFALDTSNGRVVAHRADERFAMCSTFKWVLAAQVLARGERGELDLDSRVPYCATDLLDHAPVTREHAHEGSMTVAALAQAAVVTSDNTAANLLLAQLGGPAAFSAFVRSQGDEVTRLDRIEPHLNENALGDLRDTTSPRAMVGLLRRLLCEDAISPASRWLLLQWMKESTTGKDRLRAGLPRGWDAGDKTGTGKNGACNDVAFLLPPRRAPLLIAVYATHGLAALERVQAAHVEVARQMVRHFG